MPARSAASKTVGTRMYPRSGFHEFQSRPCAPTSNPDSIAACDGSVDAWRMVIARSEYAPRLITASWTGGRTSISASGRSPSSLTMITWRTGRGARRGGDGRRGARGRRARGWRRRGATFARHASADRAIARTADSRATARHTACHRTQDPALPASRSPVNPDASPAPGRGERPRWRSRRRGCPPAVEGLDGSQPNALLRLLQIPLTFPASDCFVLVPAPRRPRRSRRLLARCSSLLAAAGCAHTRAGALRLRQGLPLRPRLRAGPVRLGAAAAPASPAVPARPGAPAALPLPQYAIEPAQAMFRFGPSHRGRSPYVLPTKKPAVWWSYTTGGPITSSPAIAEDGSLVFGSHDGKLYVLGARRRAQVVARDGRHHLQLAGHRPRRHHLHRLRRRPPLRLAAKTERPRWVFQVGSCPQRLGIGPEASRCDVDAGPDGRPGRRHLHRRRRHLRHQPRRDAALALPHRRARLVGAGRAGRRDRGGRLPGRPDLRRRAQRPEALGLPRRRRRRVQPRGRRRRDDLRRLRRPQALRAGPDGTLRWAFTTGGDVRSSAAIGNGVIYIGSFDAQLYAVHADGTLAWTFRTGDRIISSPLVDSKGAVVFGSQDDRLYCLEPDGRLRWSVELGGDIDSSPVLGRRRDHLRRLRRQEALRAARRRHALSMPPAREFSFSGSPCTFPPTSHYWQPGPRVPKRISFDSRRPTTPPPRRLDPDVTGRIKIHPVGYGFVVPDDKSEDVHVSARSRGAAMDADTVEIEAWSGVRGMEGRVLRVLSRGRAKITGQLERRGQAGDPAARRPAHHRPGLRCAARSPLAWSARRWSRRSPATPTSPTAPSRPRC